VWRSDTHMCPADVAIRLQPRAKRTEVVGERDGRVVVRVTAPPVDGRANKALCALIAERAGVAPGRVAVVWGHTGRDKVVRVKADVSARALRDALLGG
jgi:uncharacterized protein (TIGR00251 family)